jgi:putative hemolysin
MRYGFLVIIFLGITFSATAEDYLLRRGKEVVTIPVETFKGSLVNDICREKKNQCLALKVLNQKPKGVEQIETAHFGSKAEAYCYSLEGSPINLLDSKGSSRTFCAFADKTLIDTWELFNAHKLKAGR